MSGKCFLTVWNRFQKHAVRSATGVVVAEWLRRWTRNPLGSSRVGSNPTDYVVSWNCLICIEKKLFTFLRNRGLRRNFLESENWLDILLKIRYLLWFQSQRHRIGTRCSLNFVFFLNFFKKNHCNSLDRFSYLLVCFTYSQFETWARTFLCSVSFQCHK